MGTGGLSVLVDCLRQTDRIDELGERQWDAMLRQARKSFLMAQLARLVEARGLTGMTPSIARNQLDAGTIICRKIERDIRRELDHLRDALRGFGGRMVLLKGAAYLLAGLPAAQGRMFGDIDILVRRADLPTIEALLNQAGWSTEGTDPYDEDYYRRWTHELPPMEHIERGSIIDVHHAIVQERDLKAMPRDEMIDAATPVDDLFHILQPTDMVLHACVHLFNDGEFDKGLRDLVDIVSLVRHFERACPDFRAVLMIRAAELSFETQLYFGMRYGALLLGLEHPAGYLEAIRPSSHNDAVHDALFLRALEPDHPTSADRWSHAARKLLYYRGHYLRMPLRHLLPHLIRKALMPEPLHPAMQTQARGR